MRSSTFADRLQLIMNRKGCTINDLAGQLGASRGMVSHWLNRRNEPQRKMLEKLLLIFPDVNPLWLITGRGEPFFPSSSPSLFDSGQERGSSSPPSRELSPNISDPDVDGFTGDTPSSPSTASKPVMENNGVLSHFSTSKPIQAIILLYDDGTYDIYRPRVSEANKV